MNVLIASLTDPEAAILNAPEGGAGVPKLAIVTVKMADRERAIRGRLHFFQQLRASLNRDSVALAGDPFQFGNSRRQNLPESLHFIHGHLSGSCSAAMCSNIRVA
jgi:hypothetical protein